MQGQDLTYLPVAYGISDGWIKVGSMSMPNQEPTLKLNCTWPEPKGCNVQPRVDTCLWKRSILHARVPIIVLATQVFYANLGLGTMSVNNSWLHRGLCESMLTGAARASV
jgi:hypothetical protein